MARRRSRQRRPSTLQQFRALPPAGKIAVITVAGGFTALVIAAGTNAKPPPVPAVPAVTVAPVSTYQPPAYTPPPAVTPVPLPTDDSDGGGDLHHPHVYVCVGHHIRACS
jgi:hypothetical protein